MLQKPLDSLILRCTRLLKNLFILRIRPNAEAVASARIHHRLGRYILPLLPPDFLYRINLRNGQRKVLVPYREGYRPRDAAHVLGQRHAGRVA